MHHDRERREALNRAAEQNGQLVQSGRDWLTAVVIAVAIVAFLVALAAVLS